MFFLLHRISRDIRPDARLGKILRRISLLIGVLIALGCQQPMAQQNSAAPQRDINAVLRDHDKELLALPGVVGVYVGLLDQSDKVCLKVMLARDLPETRRAIPKFIEGY